MKLDIEIDAELIVVRVSQLLEKVINQDENDEILKKTGINYDAWTITKNNIENDLKLRKAFLKLT